MSEELVCPDCGGFIGLESGDTRQACSCFTPPRKLSAEMIAPPVKLRPAIARMMNTAKVVTDDRAESQTGGTDLNASGEAPSISESDTQSIAAETDAPPAVAGKSCRRCGKDLTGKKRLKDSLGYICPECVKAEKTVDETGRVPCPECNHKIKPAGFVPFNGKFICRKCFADHMDLDKYKTPVPNAAGFKIQQKQSLGRLLILAGVLLALMALSAYKTFFAH